MQAVQTMTVQWRDKVTGASGTASDHGSGPGFGRRTDRRFVVRPMTILKAASFVWRLEQRWSLQRRPSRLCPMPVVRLLLVLLAARCATHASALSDDPAATHPREARWSIATGWSDGWPTAWHHANPVREELAGEWTVYHGVIVLPSGRWLLRDAERDKSEGVREIRRRWEWDGAGPAESITLSFRRHLRAPGARPFLPGISSYDNPAGQSIDGSRIPVIAAATPLRRGFYEEHRFPLPFAAIEAGEEEGGLYGAALHTVPTPIRFGHHDDQWWSLGVQYLDDHHVEIAAYSGPVASNGRNAIIKGHQRRWHDYDQSWCRFPPGAIVEKTFYFESFPVSARGRGFQTPLWTSLRLNEPFDATGFPRLKTVLARKFADTLARWRTGPSFAGIDAFPGEERPWIDLGWAGQSEAFAFPMLRLGDQFGVSEIDRHVQEGLDFIATSPFGPDGFAIRYDYRANRWMEQTNPLSQGQTMNNLLDALHLARTRTALDSIRWEQFLRRACDWHAGRLLAPDWHPRSTNEAFLMAPLAKAARLLKEPRYLQAAQRAGEHYAKRHLSMDEPYWGGTLDARCEDKEGAWAAMQGWLALYDATRDPRYLTWAQHAGDVILSYLYIWDVPLPAGRLTDHAFKTRGWTAVSVQNMHLDVYGVLCAPAFWHLGELTGNSDYQRLARLMLVSCGQLLDPFGSQGEQVHQTNYAQHYAYTELPGVRGDYVETWNVYWITAHFLVAAAHLSEMGVDWQVW
jgi:hypothetical protein